MLLKVKGLDIYIPPLAVNDQQRFTIQSGVLTGNDTRWRSASSGNPLPESTDFGCRNVTSMYDTAVFKCKLKSYLFCSVFYSVIFSVFIVTIVIRYCTFLYCKLAYTKRLSCNVM